MQLLEGLRAFHGSPYDFDVFDAASIGSGEGSQMYGFGLYFAGNKATARSYKAMAANPARRAQTGLTRVGRDQVVLDSIIRLSAMKYAGGDATALADVIKKHPRAFDKPEALLQRISQWHGNQPPSYMYEVEIHADPDRFADWDKPLDQQNPIVQAFYLRHAGITPDMSGGAAYRKLGPGREVSARMSAEGIPGIVHRDAGSLYGMDRTNYVVFDPAVVEIRGKSKDDDPVS